MIQHERYCPYCHFPVAPYDPDRDPEGKFHRSCAAKEMKKLKRIEAHRLAVLYLMGLLLLALPAAAARQRSPQVSCVRQDALHAACEMTSYFGTWQPKWEVWAGDALVADGTGKTFAPVIGEDWRTVKASVPWNEGKLIFEFEVRSQGDTAQFRAADKEAVYIAAK